MKAATMSTGNQIFVFDMGKSVKIADLANAENTLPTDHHRINIAKVREYDYNDALKVAEELENLSRAVEIPDMVRLMKRTVPEFKSKNSVYEQYDKELELWK